MSFEHDTVPYGDVVDDLVRSTMLAQADLISLLPAHGGEVDNVPDAIINRHFAWLALVYTQGGKNRHLFDGIGDNFPLKTTALRAPKKIEKEEQEIAKLLRARKPLPISDGAAGEDELSRRVRLSEVVQPAPTRISRLIKAACKDFLDGDRKVENSDRASKKERGAFFLRSPLSLVYDYLTIPEMPGTRGYALVSLRNYIFEAFQIFPDGISSLSEDVFSVREVELAFSHIWTSMRPRHWSTGKDPLPAEGRVPVDGLVRHFLALKANLWMRFAHASDRLEYLQSANFRGTKQYEFAGSPHLEKLPDVGEIVNELWGIPVPIRGADTVLRGGLRFSSQNGLVLALHGGPGSGKTSLALAIGRYLAPFGIETLFLTAEEQVTDLRVRADGLIADELRRLPFLPDTSEDWLKIERYSFGDGGDLLDSLMESIDNLSIDLNSSDAPTEGGRNLTPKPCRAIVVLDGLHDLIIFGAENHVENDYLGRLRTFIERCRKLRALVILTTSNDWAVDTQVDYLVDFVVRLSHVSSEEYGKKPDRRVMISKSRYQLSAIGTHGFQLAGSKGVRFSPQINYQLDRRSIWKTRLPNPAMSKDILQKALAFGDGLRAATDKKGVPIKAGSFRSGAAGVKLPAFSNIFINGKGSGAKAAMALKIAVAPSFAGDRRVRAKRREKIMVVSFLYPEEYYDNIIDDLVELRRLEYPGLTGEMRPHCKTLHLYPGNLKPNDLFNRIEWELDAAELHGEPFDYVIVDGLHNVFLQFPEIEAYDLFWPQLYAALRSRPVSIITTHTTFMLQDDPEDVQLRVDDRRSEPLKHALVQKTDFQFEVSPFERTPLYRQWMDQDPKKDLNLAWIDQDLKKDLNLANVFLVRTLSAIGQPIPKRTMLWSRERLVFFESPTF